MPDAQSIPSSIAILGSGQMGLVCAGILTSSPTFTSQRSTRVILWSHSSDEAGVLTQTRRSHRLAGFVIPDAVGITHDLGKALSGASLIVSAVPVQYIRPVWTDIGQRAPSKSSRTAKPSVVSVAKGVENTTLLRPTQIVAEALADDPDGPPRALATLSGPTIAPELARCLPATMIAASDSHDFAVLLQRLFSTHWLRIYTSDDLLGVELAGAAKNVIAIAAGILDGLQAGYNAKSALLARGLAEIKRLGTAMGASSETFFGIAGVGDLATTCFSPEGRNRSCGEALGRGAKLDEYLASTPHVVEGVATTRSLVDLAAKYRVEMPITQSVYSVLFQGTDPIDAIGKLMSRELKQERVG